MATRIKKPRFTKAERVLAHAIVAEDLGEGFQLEDGVMPRNVGVKGDEGLWGETLLITTNAEDPLRIVIDEADLLEGVVKRLGNEIRPVTKVLFDITPR